MKHGICFCLVLLLPAAAHAQVAAGPPQAGPLQTGSAYRSVMQAQYAAREAPQPATPQEAERIYELYLHSIGQMLKNNTNDAGSDAGTPAH